MTKIAAILALLIPASACRSHAARAAREEAQVVALSVRTEPPGARVRVNGLDRGWTTPCDVADYSLRRGPLDVEIALEGHRTSRHRVTYDGRMPAHLSVRLAADDAGTVVLVNAAAGAAAYLLRVPPDAADPGTFVRLWSENEPALQEALSRISDEDARRAPMRIRDLARIGSPAVRALAGVKAGKLGAVPDPRPVARKAVADLNGIARFADVPGGELLHVFATRAGATDFHRPGVTLAAREELTIDAAMAPRPVEKPALPAAPAENVRGPVPPRMVRVRSPGGLVRVSVAGKPVAELTSKPGELVQLSVPEGPVRVEFADAKTGELTHSVDLLPDRPEPPAAAEGERVGQVQLVHPVYGVFVRLDAGLQVSPGDEIVIAREGLEIARATVVRVAGADETYPDGAAQVGRASGIRKGDEVRRPR